MEPYIKLAYQTIEAYFKENKIMPLPSDLPKEMLAKKAGVFVSLHKKNHELRGCIGTLSPTTENIATEIRQNALSAAFEDPRFLPLKKRELADLIISVDVLNPAQEIKSLAELDPNKFGIIVAKGYHKGVLLPAIEGVNTIDEQIVIACQKAGLDPEEKNYKIYKFTVTRHEQ